MMRVHILYESSPGGVPHGCSHIRLIRPLSHPACAHDIEISHGPSLPLHYVDVVIVERFWDQSCDWEVHQPLFSQLKRQGTRVLLELDDDLLSLEIADADLGGGTQRKCMWLRLLARYADGIIVSTPELGRRMATLNRNIQVVPNALDERLFEPSRGIRERDSSSEIVVFGYMGTYTHLEDLHSVIRPLRSTLARHADSICFEVVGVGDARVLNEAFAGLPFSVRSVPTDCVEYERFAQWMQQEISWDFAIAPLIDSPFSRSKSDIKFLDYAIQGIPGIYSNVPAYRNTIRPDDDGLLASTEGEWEAALERMATNAALRERLAHRAHERVWSERTLEAVGKRWRNAIDALVLDAARREALDTSLDARLRIALGTRLSRNEKIMYGCRPDGTGLEIGPSFSGVAQKRMGFNVEILDHADAETLRKKYAAQGVDVSRIEEVDHVWSGEPLQELTGRCGYYDWIIASHVIEHMPDLVSFLRQCEVMLKEDGVLCLAIPDHRFCFDVFRPASTPGDVIQAYLDRVTRHPPGVVWDHFSMIVRKGGVVSWSRGHTGAYEFVHPNLGDALEYFDKARSDEEYIDVHHWRFTPASFRLILADLQYLDCTELHIQRFFDTEGCEFIVQLRKCSAQTRASSANRMKLVQEMGRESRA